MKITPDKCDYEQLQKIGDLIKRCQNHEIDMIHAKIAWEHEISKTTPEMLAFSLAACLTARDPKETNR